MVYYPVPDDRMSLATAAADPDIVAEAREWLSENVDFHEWPDITADDVADLPADEVVWLIREMWGGGLPSFLNHTAADITARRTARQTTDPTAH